MQRSTTVSTPDLAQYGLLLSQQSDTMRHRDGRSEREYQRTHDCERTTHTLSIRVWRAHLGV